MSLRSAIDEAPYLYIGMVGEGGDGTLRLIVHEARAGGEPEDLDVAGVTLAGAIPIVADETTPKYEVRFASYVAYSVRNESYVSWDESETWTGRLFRVYTDSKFLDYVGAATFATDEYPGPLTHYELATLNHIVDVVTTVEPGVERIS